MNEIPSGACDWVEQNESEGERYVSYVTLPSLQEMATYRVVLTIWYGYISRKKYNELKKTSNDDIENGLGIDDEYCNECNKTIESLKTPRPIEEVLKSAFESILDEIRSWIRHFKYDTFSYTLEKHYIGRYDAECCVWLPNGKIDYVKTAPKMLATPGLSDVQKFAIMSVFCLEDEIAKFSSRLLPKSFVKQVTFDRDYLIYYWIRYLRNDLRNLPLNNFNSIDKEMAAMCRYEHRIALEYFWNRLGADDQVEVAVFRCDGGRGDYSHQPRIFSRMSWQQQRRVLSRIPHRILLNFWIHFRSPESAMWSWDHSKDSMTVEQFAQVVTELFGRCKSFDNEMRMFMRIWNTASDEQRNHFAATSQDDLIRSISYSCNCSTTFEFLYAFLSLKSPDFRRRVVQENAGGFGSHVDDPNWMNDVIKLCLPSVEDQLEYKKLVMESHDMQQRGEFMFNDTNLLELKIRLQYYSTDPSIAQGYLKTLLESKWIRKHGYIVDSNEWNKFGEFVDDIFSNDPESGLNLKKTFITSYASKCLNDWNDENSLNEMIKVLDTVFTTDDELQMVKRMFLESFKKSIVDMDYWPWFEEKYFNKFVSWCVGSDQGVVEFKKSISIEAIFDEYFGTFEGWYSEDGGYDKSLLPDLDKCLRWYFEGVEGARDFKLAKINDFEKIGILKIILERNDDASSEEILKWFFDDDEEGVRKFKKERLKIGKK